MTACVDSGAVVQVLGAQKEVPKHPVQVSKAQAKGTEYVAANGARIANEGKVKLKAVTEEGVELPEMTWQNAKVSMPILSVRRLVRKGSRVEFAGEGGTIYLPDGNEIKFFEKIGVYMIHLYIQPPDGGEGFGGLGS